MNLKIRGAESAPELGGIVTYISGHIYMELHFCGETVKSGGTCPLVPLVSLPMKIQAIASGYKVIDRNFLAIW